MLVKIILQLYKNALIGAILNIAFKKGMLINIFRCLVFVDMFKQLVAMVNQQFLLFAPILFQTFYASPQAKSVLFGKKFLCFAVNSRYIANSTCTIRFINRWTQLYDMSIDLQPNVTLDNMHVNIYSLKFFFKHLTQDFILYVGSHTIILQIQYNL